MRGGEEEKEIRETNVKVKEEEDKGEEGRKG